MNRWISVGALSAALAVALGAFGAHGLKDHVDAAALENWRTGVLYHVLHALALVLYGLALERRPARAWPAWCFLFGSTVFSATLYLMVLGGPRWLGAITPFGGTALIAGWIGFAVQAWPRASRSAR